MGLIRSRVTTLTPSDDEELTEYLWPVVREIIKTAIENKQNLIVEGCYIPFNWYHDFDQLYLDSIQYICIVMSEKYIKNHFNDIKKYSNVIESRLDDSSVTMETVLADNSMFYDNVMRHGLKYILIDDDYDINVDLNTL